jgi:hypothetical protein
LQTSTPRPGFSGGGRSFGPNREVTLAREVGCKKVIFASDCLALVQRITSSRMDRFSVSILVSGIKEVSKYFTSVSFTHVKRHLNEAAHILAKSCFSVSSSEVFYSVPDYIRETLCIGVI